MVKCVCDRPIEKMPVWLESVKVDFVCTNCPKRQQVKSIAQLHNEQQRAAKVEDESMPDIDADMDEEED